MNTLGLRVSVATGTGAIYAQGIEAQIDNVDIEVKESAVDIQVEIIDDIIEVLL